MCARKQVWLLLLVFSFVSRVFGAERDSTEQEALSKLIKENVAYIKANKKLPDTANGRILTGADLSKSHAFLAINFSSSLLQNAKMNASSFAVCNFTEADFSNANLSGSLFFLANIKGAIFKGTILSGTDLSMAIPRVSLEYLRQQGAIWDEKNPPKVIPTFNPEFHSKL